MIDYTNQLPLHEERYIGQNDLMVEFYKGDENRAPLVFVHGAYTGSWMWSRFVPHFVEQNWDCMVMNLRGHYRSRAVDLTRTSFEDYLEDIKAVLALCERPPVLIGFSMGGILCQKLAESVELAGLVSIDASICREVNEKAPYSTITRLASDLIVPAPVREETSSIDENEEQILFQKKYLAMESAMAFRAFSFAGGADQGISVDSSRIKCPSLVIRAISDQDAEGRGRAEATHLHAEYLGLRDTTHTGLLIGNRYYEVVEKILQWFCTNVK